MMVSINSIAILSFVSCIIFTLGEQLNIGGYYDLKTPLLKQEAVEKQNFVSYIAHKYDIAHHFSFVLDGSNSELINLITTSLTKADNEKPNLFVVVSGVEQIADFFNSESIKPRLIFTEEESFDNEELVGTLFEQFPIMMTRNPRLIDTELTDGIRLISPKGKESTLAEHFRFFDEKLISIWDAIKLDINRISNYESERKTINLVNDDLFKIELSRLQHLTEFTSLAPSAQLFVSLNSLNSIARKIGYDSVTYQSSQKILSDFILKLSSIYNVELLTLPMSSTPLCSVKKNVFAKRDSAACYLTEESCQVATSNCNSHGICSKFSECWSCSCSASYNEVTKKTIKWAGFDCNKKDVSAEANLFLWTGVIMIALVAAGIKLLYSVGGESLPGVLDAATVAKKNI